MKLPNTPLQPTGRGLRGGVDFARPAAERRGVRGHHLKGGSYRMIQSFILAVLVVYSQVVLAQPQAEGAAMRHSVEELRTAVGRWEVLTKFLNADGSVAKSVNGTYEFSWVVPDRVVAGVSAIPELKQTAGILFYINEGKQEIEMVSVGGDGRLWVMTGPVGGDVRHSQEYKTADGGIGRLRFTRQNVLRDQFESRMEYTEDGGKTWKPGNHQTFRRVTQPTR